ncbi:hypothetical protein DPMN_017951 [Dreissena polymorpha]|uniref:Uncharacterized protein n=1 Tax=Dreissena polymorpha TaxID=45954 RepID=A0A9D4NHI1_DREPO|nr:hypothetical protein DPMN_017951 [Dreissena polymorpha]
MQCKCVVRAMFFYQRTTMSLTISTPVLDMIVQTVVDATFECASRMRNMTKNGQILEQTGTSQLAFIHVIWCYRQVFNGHIAHSSLVD